MSRTIGLSILKNGNGKGGYDFFSLSPPEKGGNACVKEGAVGELDNDFRAALEKYLEEEFYKNQLLLLNSSNTDNINTDEKIINTQNSTKETYEIKYDILYKDIFNNIKINDKEVDLDTINKLIEDIKKNKPKLNNQNTQNQDLDNIKTLYIEKKNGIYSLFFVYSIIKDYKISIGTQTENIEVNDTDKYNIFMNTLSKIKNTLDFKKSNPENIKNIKKLLNEIEESNKKIKDINDLNEILNFRKLKEPEYNNYINKEIENIFKELQKEINNKIQNFIDNTTTKTTKFKEISFNKNNRIEKIYKIFEKIKKGGIRRYTRKNQKIKNNITKRFR
jgi:hypothetical protein